MAYFLAIDAGGTKAEFLLADEDGELARARSGSIKRLRVSDEVAWQNLRQGLEEIWQQSGIAASSIVRTCVGTAGETVPLDVEWLLSALGSSVGGEVILVSDVEIALDAAFRGGSGVLVLAGTGSNVAGRGQTGKIVTAGGWGPTLADQGSGHYLGVEGLRRGFLAIDQQRPTELLTRAMAMWKLATLNDLVEFANTNPAPNFSHLAPVVVDCANRGDAVAVEVLEQGGRDLATLAALVIERTHAADAATGLPPEHLMVAVAGSILREVGLLRQALEESLRATYPEVRFVEEAVDPIHGALWRARRGREVVLA